MGVRLVALGILVALGVGAMISGASRNRLVLSLAKSTLLLVAVWVATAAMYYSDWRDADGFVDCWPNCTTYQDASGTILVGLPVVLAAWVVAAALIGWRRSRAPTR